MEQRYSDNETSRRDIPSFIEPRPPLINNPFMRPRPQKGTNLMELFEEDSEFEEPELVQVYLRMKPCEVPNNLYEVRSDKCLVTSLDTTTAGHGRRTQHNVSRMYTFSQIFDAQCSQKEIFEQVVKDNLKKLPDGHSFTLLTYGASGSGKTYTLMGTVNSPGLVPRSLEYVFQIVDASQQPTYKPSDGGADRLGCSQQEFELQWVKRLRQVSAPQRDKYRRMSAQLKNDRTVSSFDLTNKHYVWVSFVEIYNEAIYDLLAPPDKRTKLRIREDSSGQVYAKGVTQAFVRTGVEAYDVLVAGKHNLVVAATGIHAQSSRSHCIFTITMLTETGGEIRTSCVRLCDLAGCERARATHNTGTRMQESRAINSSLHVLERCLHMLRRKQKQRQEALVPYRESKLTRLLGSGLSGSRGEAVSMVVTLNPSPQYAHETKHVLSLAAVAQDIQINNTAIFGSTLSTLESITPDTTISSNAEAMKLRADNERLHFELVQAQARNKELLAAMEESQEQSASTMRELVEEAKDMTKEFYVSQIVALQSEMDDMVEEYEARLSKSAAPPITSTGTPTRFLQTKVSQLMTEIAVLEDKLSAERLARARAEEEVKHLRTCIDERDEKTYKETVPENYNDVLLTDSDDETSDLFNQSLEPVFRKECINQSLARSSDHEIKNILKEDTVQVIKDKEVEEDESDESTDTIKQDDYTPKNSDYETGDESEIIDRKDISGSAANLTNTIDEERNDSSHMISRKVESKIDDLSYTAEVPDEIAVVNKSGKRDTSFVPDIEQQDNGPNESIEIKSEVRGRYFVKTALDCSNDEDINAVKEEVKMSRPEKARGTYFVRKSAIDSSNDEIDNPQSELEKSETDKSRGTYFVRKSAADSSSGDEIVADDENESEARGTYYVRTSAIDTSIDEEMQEVVEHKTLPQENVPEEHKSEAIEIKHIKSETLVSKIIKSLKKSTHNNNSDSSLRLFEQLELASEECGDSKDRSSAFGNIKILKEKRTYFDENIKTEKEQIHVKPTKSDDSETSISSNRTKELNEEKFYVKHKLSNVAPSWDNLDENVECVENKTNSVEVLISKPANEKCTYSDNIEVSELIPNNIVTGIKSSARKNHERSPSIISDDAYKPLQPSTMKKLLGENIAKLEVLSSIHKNNDFVKKHDSIDVFDESPLVKNIEVNATPLRKVSNVDEVRKSIEKLVLEQKTRHEIKEPKLESMSSLEEEDSTIKKHKFQEPVPFKEHKINKNRNTVADNKKSTMELNNTQNNTIEEFENIFKDLSTQRATEFDLLTVNEETDNLDIKDDIKTETDTKSDKIEQKEKNKEIQKNTEAIVINKQEEIKYNLRRKGKPIISDINENQPDEVLLESSAKCESKAKQIRSLRLRRRKNVDEEYSDQDTAKLKDIMNLKKEFCDVTLDLPATKKVVKDIPSPEKLPGEENLPPMGIQSCPSKSVTRSRRKLFTPRAEPLEESFSQTGDSNERIHVPRPSYHKKARRKL